MSSAKTSRPSCISYILPANWGFLSILVLLLAERVQVSACASKGAWQPLIVFPETISKPIVSQLIEMCKLEMDVQIVTANGTGAY